MRKKFIVLRLLVFISLLLMYSAMTVKAGELIASNVISLDGENWLLAIDTDNVGRDKQWYQKPRAQAKPAKVPWIIQDAFPGYHGVAWYWREFDVPVNPHKNGRYLLRFWAVDYKAEVWVNNIQVGEHEGGETPFTLDITKAVNAGTNNLLSVRVLNPTRERIDGLTLDETPHRCKLMPYQAGAAFNHGGITDSVELIITPALRIDDLFVCPDPATGIIHIQAIVHNNNLQTTQGQMQFSAATATSGEAISISKSEFVFSSGDTPVTAALKIQNPHLWELNDPYLYRVTAQVRAQGSDSLHECSTRCGFREFRFTDGYFRLNGRRLFLRSSHTVNHYPIGLQFPHDPDLARRDLLNAKVMGFNMVRFIWGGALRYQLDLCDEIGLMVYEEHYGSSPIAAEQPMLGKRFDDSLSSVILRDRNHPSIVIWGLLNEIPNNAQFRHAVQSLDMVRSLDAGRMVLLNSGRWDGQYEIGAISNPDSNNWEPLLGVEGPQNVNAVQEDIAFDFTVKLKEEDTVDFAVGVGIDGCGADTTPVEIIIRKIGNAEDSEPKNWNITKDISFEKNPNGPWSYGMAPKPDNRKEPDTHTLTLFTNLLADASIPWWHFNPPQYQNVPALFQNTSQKILHGCPPGLVALHGGCEGEEMAVARWTAPHAGTFRVTGTFYHGDVGSCDYYVIHNKNKVLFRQLAMVKPGVPSGINGYWTQAGDAHMYPPVPQQANMTSFLRHIGDDCPNHVFLSEYGIGSAVDLWRTVRHFERLGKQNLEDGQFYADKLNRFLTDWENWHLDECFTRPTDFFAESLARMASQRSLGLNAIRSNPNLVGYNLTGMIDHVMTGEGLTTPFREFKPGAMEAVFDGFAPLRLCLFAEPAVLYRGTDIKLEAVLANEDMLPPGDYTVRLCVLGPDQQRILDRIVSITIPETQGKRELPLALPVFEETIKINGSAGTYQFLANFEKGAAAAGGKSEFFVDDPADMPAIETEVELWGDDVPLFEWLTAHCINVRPYDPAAAKKRGVILISGTPPAAMDTELAFNNLTERIRQGTTAIFLSPEVLQKDDQPTGWLPLNNKGALTHISSWLYLTDVWAKHHAFFEGLPAGGLLDYTFYREIISSLVWVGQDPPDQAVAGSIKASQDYASGLILSVYNLGEGRLILNSLRIRENLGIHPAAERLLRNMLRYAEK
ncbi:MAG: hypothetical protein JW709_06035 [Sedimentisphaerales bacterium]|nr:hypothetical protein [Sedimentisphaerales bacterium]